MEKIEYDKTIWIKKVTPLSADNYNHIEDGIEQATIAINSLIDIVGSDSVKSINLSWLEKTLVIKLYNENEEVIAQSSISFDDYAKLEDVARKVDKILNPNRVYGTDDQGEQTSYPISANVENNNIVIRDGAGQIKVPLTPTQNDHATSKKYIDDIITNIKKDHYKKVDITEYPTLNDFLASTGEEGYLYLYPIDTSEAPTFESGYYRYVWENNAWLDLGTTQIDLSDYVTLDTDQTITGNKIFNIGGNTIAFKAVNWGGQQFTIILDNGGGDGSYITYDDASTSNFYYFKLPQKSGEFALLEDFETETSKNQTAAVIVGNAVTNINGRVFQNYTATLVTSGSYIYYQILKNGNYPTEGEAKEYMRYMTGSTFLPRYNYDFPKQTLFIFSNGSIWKPQYSNTDGLRLYRLQKSYNEIFVDLDSVQTITGAKTFKNQVDFIDSTDTSNIINSVKTDNDGNLLILRNNTYFVSMTSSAFRIKDRDLLPGNGNTTYSLGSSAAMWKDLYLSGSLKLYSTYGSGTTYSIEADDSYGQLRVAHGSTRLLTINDNGIMPNGTRDLGSSSYPWQDLYLNGDINLSNTGPHNINFGSTAYAQISSSAIYVNRRLSTGIVEPQTTHSPSYTVGSSSKVWYTVFTDNISDGTVSTTIADIYDSIWNTQNTVASGDSLSVTQFNTINSNANISVDNKYLGYEELKGLFVNTHTTNSIVVTFLRGLKGFLCNDDNVVFNGTDQITIPANTSIEFSIVNGFMCAVNFDA